MNDLGSLPPEPWGWKMKRAREEYAALTLDQAADAIGRYMHTSTASISRMEDSEGVPTDKRRRALACIASLTYGLDPEQFGVTVDDVPASTAAALNTGVQVLPQSRCTRLSLTAVSHPTPIALNVTGKPCSALRVA